MSSPVSHADRLACPRHQVSASTLRSTKKRVPVEPLLAITQYQSGPVTTPPRIINDWGQQPCRAQQANTLKKQASRDTYKVTGIGDVGCSGEPVDADGEVADAGHGVGGVAGAHL